MADTFEFYVRDSRKITYDLSEQIMQEDTGVTNFRFHIPKTLNNLDVSEWSWWFVFVNAKKEKYSILLELEDDPEEPFDYNVAVYTVDYAMTIKSGSVQFALEAINTGTGGTIDREWHTYTYETKIKETLQGNQAEYAETESDIISELLQEVRTKMNQVIGGATPAPAASVSAMTDPSKLYLLTTDGEWYYHNGTAFVSGGVYGAGITDPVPTQGSTNAVQSGGVYDALEEVEENINGIKSNIDVKNPSLVLTSGSYIYKTGEIKSGASFAYTAPIAVHTGEIIQLTGAGYATNVAMISTCDANGINISPVVISIDADVHDYVYNVVEDGYILVCFHSGKEYSLKIYGVMSNSVMFKDIADIKHSLENDLAKSVTNTFEKGTWRNGSKNTDSYAIRSTDGFKVDKYSQIIIKSNGQYFYLYAYRTRTESEGNISFSNLVTSISWQNTDAIISVPKDTWLVIVVRKTYPTNTAIIPEENLVQTYVADSQIIQNKGNILELAEKVEILGGDVPEYWETEVSSAIVMVSSNRLTIGKNLVEFFFITDIHWNGNAKKSPVLINKISADLGIRDVFIGGDVIYTHDISQMSALTEIQDFYKRFDASIRMFSTIGNHDLNSNSNQDTSSYLSPDQLYTIMMKNEEAFTDTDASPYVTVYDNVSQKVRFIQFYHPDVIAIPQETQTAVISAIQAKNTDWTVVLMCHVYWSANDAVDTYIQEFTEQLAQINEDGNYAKIAALIVGHKHYDASTIVDNNLLVIASQCDIYRQTSGSAMTAGTDTEQAFDIYQIDTVQRKIYITRIGSGEDREFTY